MSPLNRLVGIPKSSVFAFVASMLLGALGAVTSVAAPVNGAAFTTTNPSVDGPGHCKNGNEAVNCNIYDRKQYVWLSGGPLAAHLSDGTYFFAVLVPGGQGGGENPNDGTPKNLSDNNPFPTSNTPGGDAISDRTFSISGGAITYSGSHTQGPDSTANDVHKIRLYPYDNTTNPGGVYILAICSLGDGYPVDPSKCKYDAFKVEQDDPEQCLVALGQTCPCDPATQNCGSTEQNLNLFVTKTANGKSEEFWSWDIAKSVDKTLVKQVGGSATFNYTITVTNVSSVSTQVTGTITLSTLSGSGSTSVALVDSLIDVNLMGCTIKDAGGSIVTDLVDGEIIASPIPYTAGDELTFTYVCGVDGKPLSASSTNVVDVFGANNPSATANFTYEMVETNECALVTDTFNGSATSFGSVCATGGASWSANYAQTIPMPQWGCQTYNNTAATAPNDRGDPDSDSKSVTVCGPVNTGAHTIGFWQNKNGQAILSGGASTAGVCASGAFLRTLAPLSDAPLSCANVAKWVMGVVKAANSSGSSMHAMLKAQMLSTALSVFFSDPANGNPIAAPAPIGPVVVDLNQVCTDLSCASYQDVGAAFNGLDSASVMELLNIASSATYYSEGVWYGGVKGTQELAKDTFDAINNKKVFAP